jgi:hypothetical protein
VAFSVCLVVLIAGCGQAEPDVPRPTEDPSADDRAREAACEAMRGHADAIDEAFRRAFATIRTSRLALLDARCAVSLPPPPSEGPVDPDVPVELRERMAPFRVQEVGEDDELPSSSRSAAALRSELDDRCAAASASEIRGAQSGYEVVVLASERVAPIARSDGTLEPGSVRGRAYLFDPAAGTIACGADFAADSSVSVATAFVETSHREIVVNGRVEELPAPLRGADEREVRELDRQAVLDLDLHTQMVRAIHAGLRQLAPTAGRSRAFPYRSGLPLR